MRRSTSVRQPRRSYAAHPSLLLFASALGLGVASVLAAASPTSAPAPGDATGEPLRLGVLLDYTGRLGVHGPGVEQGIRLAVDQVNAAGGVLGQPVEILVGDGQTDPRVAVAVARDLASRGAHALVGPMGSAAALQVGAEVSKSLRLPTVTPTATSPDLAQLDDDDFLFRTALSDVAQGPVLARVTLDVGIERLAVLYQDDTYGRGLFRAFEGSFEAELTTAVEVPPEADSYLPQLRRAAEATGAGPPQALLVIAYPGATDILVKEALDHGLFDRFFFVDANFGPDVVLAVGAEPLEGQMGTIPIAAGGKLTGAATVLAELTQQVGGRPKQSALAAYDATICLALAAERAGTTDGGALRDALYDVCGSGGTKIDAGGDGVARALAAIRRGEDIDFDGATTTVDWDCTGDVTRGYVGVYRFASGVPVLVDQVTFEGSLAVYAAPERDASDRRPSRGVASGSGSASASGSAGSG